MIVGAVGLGGCFAQSLEAPDPDLGGSTTATTSLGEPSDGTTTGAVDPGLDPPDGSSTLTRVDDPDGDAETDATGRAADDGGRYGGPCCEPNDTPGCDDVDGVDACVCRLDDFCCDSEWDAVCVDLAIDLGCVNCERSGTSPTPGDCCVAGEAAACDDSAVAECVCAFDGFCCDVEWDQTCVDLVQEQQCGCGFEVSDTDTGGPTSDCCMPTSEPGCIDTEIQDCVCAVDAFCCDTAWDNQCVALVNTNECSVCVYPLGDQACCEVHDTAGCSEQEVHDCVCATDPFCCSVEWDDVCVGEVGGLECGETCPDVGTGSGTSGAGGSETGTVGTSGPSGQTSGSSGTG